MGRRGVRMMVVVSTWLLVLGGATAAWADVAGPPPSTSDRESLCEPDQEEGDSCTTDDGDDGTCIEDTQECLPDPELPFETCHICDEDCTIAAVGQQAPAQPGGLAGGLVVLLGLALLRRRSS
jgi:MYXO-CTERM domain-containing protein